MEQASEKRYVLLICLGLALATAAVYFQVYNFEFVDFDDYKYITRNEHVVNGLNTKSFVWAFTSTKSSNWHPLTWLSLMLDFEFGRLKSQACHITNLLFHIANTLLLFWVLKRMTGALWRSGFVAALFALHPLHVESVAWISERKDVLSTFFLLLTMWAYANYTEHKGLGKYALVLVFFILGLMSKPMLVTLPFVLLLLDYWPLRRLKLEKLADFRRQGIGLVVEKLPLFLLAAVSCVITFLAQKHGGAMPSISQLPFKIRFFNASISYFNYIGKMIWPVRMVVIYPYLYAPKITQVVQALLCLIVFSLVVLRLRKRFPYLLTGWLWYLGTMVPVIGLVQVGVQSMADRYTYVPLTGLFIIVAWAAVDYAKSRDWPKIALWVLSVAVLSALALGTYRQAGYWQNSVKLFEHAIDVYPVNPKAHTCLAGTLNESGDIDGSLKHFREATNTLSIDSEAVDNLVTMLIETGVSRGQQGRYSEAIGHFKEVISLRPGNIDAHYGLIITYQYQNKVDEVIKSCQKALRINPNDAVIKQWLKEAIEKKRKRNKES